MGSGSFLGISDRNRLFDVGCRGLDSLDISGATASWTGVLVELSSAPVQHDSWNWLLNPETTSSSWYGDGTDGCSGGPEDVHPAPDGEGRGKSHTTGDVEGQSWVKGAPDVGVRRP